MTTQTKITFDLSGLDGFKKSIASTYKTRVGVLGEKASRSDGGGINNAELGMIQMFGSVTNNIPPRDFLKLPIELNRREIISEMQKSGSVRAAIDKGNYKQVFVLLGLIAEGYVAKAFETGGFGQWPPLKASTIAQKGSSAPLIDTGQLKRSISSDVVKAGKI